MKRWRATFEILSPLATPLSAEQLFGHVCWGIAYREGAEAVAAFLRQMRGDSPPLVLGEPAPAGFVAMPVTLRSQSLGVKGRRRAAWEAYQRSGLMPLAGLLHAAGHLGARGLVEALDRAGWPRPVRPHRDSRVRSAASRLNGAPAGRSDWLAVEVWPAGMRAEVVIASDLEAERIRSLLEAGLSGGYGAAASAGFGQVEVAAVEPIEGWPQVGDADALVTLGPCVPRRDDPTGGAWQTRVKWGKVGGTYATDGGLLEKRPVVTLEAGAVLTTGISGEGQARRGSEEQQGSHAEGGSQQGMTAVAQAASLATRSFVGRLVEGVHPQRAEVVHYGLAPVVAVRLRREQQQD